jgi:hypothetical protein
MGQKQPPQSQGAASNQRPDVSQTAQGPAVQQSQTSQMASTNASGTAQMIQLMVSPPSPVDTAGRLRGRPRATVAFPACSDELLALIRTGKLPIVDIGDPPVDEIALTFTDYFAFSRHQTLGQLRDGSEVDQLIGEKLDPKLAGCHKEWSFESTGGRVRSLWPSDCCICEPCLTLNGYRNHPRYTTQNAPPTPGIRRLFIADALWLFFYDQMGIHQILGAILDAFAGSGRLPIPNGSLLGNTVEDNIAAVILEIMVRQTKTGLSSGVRDRAMLYRTALGWNTKIGMALSLDTEVNSGFSSLFHRFVYNALEFYRDRRLAVAIQSQAVPNARPSVATLVTLQNTLDVLRKRFEPFDYGRNYSNTLAGIVWTIAGMSVIRQLSNTLGIPTAYGDPHEFIPAAYDLLVLKRPVTRGDVNRYSVHRDCATNGRDILLDIEVLNFSDQVELENWLTQVEPKVEAYRTAYRNLTGIDLGASATAAVEQQVPAMA